MPCSFKPCYLTGHCPLSHSPRQEAILLISATAARPPTWRTGIQVLEPSLPPPVGTRSRGTKTQTRCSTREAGAPSSVVVPWTSLCPHIVMLGRGSVKSYAAPATASRAGLVGLGVGGCFQGTPESCAALTTVFSVGTDTGLKHSLGVNHRWPEPGPCRSTSVARPQVAQGSLHPLQA